MKALLSTVVFCFVALICSVQGNGHSHQTRHRRTSPPVTEKQCVECVEDKCKWQIAQLAINIMKRRSPGGDFLINEEVVNELCGDRDAIKRCISECPATTTFQNFIDIFGTFGYMCDSERDAVVSHSVCLVTAFKTANLTECFKGELMSSLLGIHRHGGGGRDTRRRRDLDKNPIAGSIQTMLDSFKTTANKFPMDEMRCMHLTAIRACVVQRAKDECDKDGETEASELTGRVFDETIRRTFKFLKSAAPAKSLFKADKCLEDGTDEAMSFFRFWF